MPESGPRVVPHVPPRLFISRPIEDRNVRADAQTRTTANSSRTRRSGDFERLKSTSEWVDVEDRPPHRRRRKKRSEGRPKKDISSSLSLGSADRSEQGALEKDFGRFLPKLSRILESRESLLSSGPRSKQYDSPRGSGTTVSRHSRHCDYPSVKHRRPVRNRHGSLQRMLESTLSFNPSLLSVLSGLTSASDRSSGSNSTITQQSYDRRDTDDQNKQLEKPRRSEPEEESLISRHHQSKSPNVFDYMHASSIDGRDGRSDTTASSRYEPSDAGSSEAPATPSSRSTLPSPTTTRSKSVAELRRKYDPSFAVSYGSVRSASPAASPLSLRKQPSVAEAVEEGDEEDEAREGTDELEAPRSPSHSRERRSSRSSSHSERHLRQQEEAMRQHMAGNMQPPYHHRPYPPPQQHRSRSISSAGSGREALYAQQMALQQYQWPSPPDSSPHLVVPHQQDGHITHAERPPVPEPPDLSQKTLAGYELLAHELAVSDSAVTPMYRKFSQLNHRVLLHLQDELVELEEQLRMLDEIIAQNDPALADGYHTPASRRGDARSQHEIFHHRKFVLGQVYVKSQQYNHYLSASNAVAKDTAPPPAGHIERFRQWMAKHAPVVEFEARFLEHDADLITPCRGSGPAPPRLQTVVAYAPLALLVPLLLFSFVPSIVGRLAVTAIVAVAIALVACSTRLTDVLSLREWSIRGAAYLTLMAAVAAVVP